MHELSITRNVVAIAAEAAAGQRVHIVTLEIGRLSAVMAEAVRSCFDVVAQDTPVEGAELVIIEVEGRGRCQDCAGEFAMANLFDPCPCGSRRIVRIRGEELSVKSIAIAETGS